MKCEIKEEYNICSPLENNSLQYVLSQIKEENEKGLLHKLYQKYQTDYGDNGLSTNILLPYYCQESKTIRDLLLINNLDDSERLANDHVKKMPNLKPFVLDSIISTTDNDHWLSQRRDIQPYFSVTTELSQLIPKSCLRAKKGIQNLLDQYKVSNIININEFFLNETQAQLQLLLFGFSNEFQEKTNKKIRNMFTNQDLKYRKQIIPELLEELKKSHGPLSDALNSRNQRNQKELIGNLLIFLFAGHDTTGNTLTWLVYELCKNQNLQNELIREVDAFWLEQGNRNIEYNDFKRLPFMTNCIMETLRLWSPIPNGTFRELVEDDYIMGKNNQKVLVKKGTYIQIPNWSRHRDKKLWGDDSDIFNPYREFIGEENWDNSVISSYNPSTERFSPFTYSPRDCIGKNFAQLEMRVILLHLFEKFRFSINQEQLDNSVEYNQFTLGPRIINKDDLKKINLGLNVNLHLRIASKL